MIQFMLIAILYLTAFVEAIDTFKLYNSQQYPDFSGVCIPKTEYFKDTSQYDQFIETLMSIKNSDDQYKSFIKSSIGCHNWDWEALQYKKTMLFYATLTMDSNNSQSPENIPLCISTCTSAVNALYAHLDDQRYCSLDISPRQNKYRMFIRETFTNVCKYAKEDKCYLGTAQETDSCGFALTSRTLDYCKTSGRDSFCCQSKLNGVSNVTDSGSQDDTFENGVEFKSVTIPESTSIPTITDDSDTIADPVIAQSSPSKLDWKVVLGIVLGVLFMIFFIIIALLIFSRRGMAKSAPVIGMSSPELSRMQDMDVCTLPEIVPSSPTRKVYTVLHPYSTEMPDELHISVNDQVLINKTFLDGWANATNLTTNASGMLPLACLAESGNESSFHLRTSSIYQNDWHN